MIMIIMYVCTSINIIPVHLNSTMSFVRVPTIYRTNKDHFPYILISLLSVIFPSAEPSACLLFYDIIKARKEAKIR